MRINDNCSLLMNLFLLLPKEAPRLLICRALFLVIIFVSCAVKAAPVTLSAETAWPLRLDENTYVLVDVESEYSWEEAHAMRGRQPSKFVVLSSPKSNRNMRATRWLSLELQNSSTDSLNLVLIPGSKNARHIDYYLFRSSDSRPEHFATGEGIPLASSAAYNRQQGYSFKLAEKETVELLVRADSSRPQLLNPVLYTEVSFHSHERRIALWDGILFGGLLLLAWGALIIALLTPNLNFAILAALCITVALYEAAVRGYAKLYLWPGSQIWALRSTTTLSFLAMALCLAFILGITRQERIHLPFRRTFIMLTGILVLFIALAWADLWRWIAPFAVPLNLVYTGTLFAAAILILRHGAPGGRLIFLTGLYLLGQAILRLMTWNNLLPDFFVTLDMHYPATNPVLALTGLALNMGILATWIIEVGRQRRRVFEELVITKQRESERLKEQVDRQTEALKRSLRYAQEADRRKTEMLGYISHDLRAPLATIVGYARSLAQTGGQNQLQSIRAIERSVDFQLALIDDILQYAKYELRPLDIHAVATHLPQLLQEFLDQARSQSALQSNNFRFDALTPLPTWVRMDAKRLQQVLSNLVVNAAKFTREGSIRISTAFTGTDGQCTFEVTVQDSGPGISLEHQRTFLKAFEQGKPGTGSVGLGLHIAHSIVRNMRGELRVTSDLGKGSTFHVSIPVVPLSGEKFIPDPIVIEAQKSSGQSNLEVPLDRDARPLPPVEARVDLAEYARNGQLTDIEAWIATLKAKEPTYYAFCDQIERALEELDFPAIESLALRDLK